MGVVVVEVKVVVVRATYSLCPGKWAKFHGHLVICPGFVQAKFASKCQIVDLVEVSHDQFFPPTFIFYWQRLFFSLHVYPSHHVPRNVCAYMFIRSHHNSWEVKFGLLIHQVRSVRSVGLAILALLTSGIYARFHLGRGGGGGGTEWLAGTHLEPFWPLPLEIALLKFIDSDKCLTKCKSNGSIHV